MSQWWIVAPLVIAAALYACWALMPASLRRRLGLPMRRRGPPVGGGEPGCGCSGCDVMKPAGRVQDRR